MNVLQEKQSHLMKKREKTKNQGINKAMKKIDIFTKTKLYEEKTNQ